MKFIKLSLFALLIVNIAACKPEPFENTPPKITLVGDNPLFWDLDENFIDPGYAVQDTEDGSLTSDVIYVSNVNSIEPGKYLVTYSVMDSEGMEAYAERVVYVMDGTDGISGTWIATAECEVPTDQENPYGLVVILNEDEFFNINIYGLWVNPDNDPVDVFGVLDDEGEISFVGQIIDETNFEGYGSWTGNTISLFGISEDFDCEQTLSY